MEGAEPDQPSREPTMDYIDYYKELGVTKTASPEEIASAYRKKARQLHPDVNKAPEAESQFKGLSEAYEVLKDKEKRQKYDQYGAAWQQAQQGGSGPGGFEFDFAGDPRGFRAHFGDRPGSSGFSSFFEHLFGGAEAGAVAWEDLFRGGGRPHTTRHLDQEAVLELSLEDAVRGGRQTINVSQTGGRSESLRVTIPPGASDGQRLRLAGQGVAEQDGRRGDLYLRIRVMKHPRFRVEDRDLHTVLEVSPAVAALGGKVRLLTLDKEIAVKVPAGSSSGKRIRLKGQGLPGAGGGQGDLYAEVRIVVPAHLTSEERELYERLAGLGSRSLRTEPSTN